LKIGFILFGALTVVGCSPTYYSYPLYKPQSRPAPQTWPLRVAIAYPEEGRSAPNRDVDLEPIITTQCHETPTYISPRLEISRGLYEELQASGAFQTVHWAPKSLDDYDLIVRTTLLDAGPRKGGERCPAFLGPWTWDLVVTDQKSRELERQTLRHGAVKLWSSSPVKSFRKAEGKFILEAVKPIMRSAETLVREKSDIQDKRTESYLVRRAPELVSMRERIASARKASELEQKYLTKLAAVQATREAEEAVTIEHQKMNEKAWADIQAQAGKELQTLGEEVRQIIANSFLMLFSGLSTASALQNAPPSDLQRTMESVTAKTAQRVEAPGGLQALLNNIPRDLLPGKTEQILSDVTKANEIVRGIQTQLQASLGDTSSLAPATQPTELGCAKDTDCKGDRICVNHRCVDPE